MTKKNKKIVAKNLKALNAKRFTIAKIKHAGVLQRLAKGETMQAASKAQGYSGKYAKSSMRKTRAWAEILDDVFSDEKLAKVHDDLLNGQRVKTFEFPPKEKPEDCVVLCKAAGLTVFKSGFAFGRPFVQCFVPDREYRTRGLEMAYKLKKYFTENINLDVNKYKSMSDSELAEAIATAAKFFKKG